MHGKKVSVIKAKAGNGIAAVRKSPIRENRVRGKIRAAGGMGLVPAGWTRGPLRRVHPRANRGTANHRPCGNRTASRCCMSNCNGCGGYEGMGAGHRSAPMLLRLPNEWECGNKKKSEDGTPHGH